MIVMIIQTSILHLFRIPMFYSSFSLTTPKTLYFRLSIKQAMSEMAQKLKIPQQKDFVDEYLARARSVRLRFLYLSLPSLSMYACVQLCNEKEKQKQVCEEDFK